MKTFPTRDEWQAAIDAGFKSNGATMSPDTIYLIRIANGNNTYPPLPADLHDYRYFMGGNEEDRKYADHEFFENMLDIIEQRAFRLIRPLAERRALKYYEAVRFLGYRFFTYKETKSDTGDEHPTSGGGE